MWRDALLVAGKDLRIEFTSRVGINQIVPFALAVLILFGFAVGPDPAQLRPGAAGLFWVAVLFATVLSVQRSFAIESSDDAADGLRLSGLDPAGIFLGKAGAIAGQLLVLEIVLTVAASLIYNVSLARMGALFATALLATAGLAALGVLYGVVAIGARVRETLLPLLFLPVAAPVLIAATKVWQDALGGAPGHSSVGGALGSGYGWMELLAIFAVAYGAIGAIAFGPLLEDR